MFILQLSRAVRPLKNCKFFGIEGGRAFGTKLWWEWICTSAVWARYRPIIYGDFVRRVYDEHYTKISEISLTTILEDFFRAVLHNGQAVTSVVAPVSLNLIFKSSAILYFLSLLT